MKKILIGSGIILFVLFSALSSIINTNLANSSLSFFKEESTLNNKSLFEDSFMPIINVIREYDDVYIKPSRLLGIFYHTNKSPGQNEIMELSQKCYICAVNYYQIVWKTPDPYYDEERNLIQPEAYQEKEFVKQVADKPTKLHYNSLTKTWNGEKWEPDSNVNYIQERECVFLEDQDFVDVVIRNYILQEMPNGKEKDYLVMNFNSAIGFYSDLDEDVPNNFSNIRNILNNLSDYELENIEGSHGWIRPIKGGRVSAHTWYYPSSFGGGVHLGMDYADSIGTPVLAVANGIILASFDGCSNDGYIGNKCSGGGNVGGGNQVYLLTKIDEITYVAKYLHLSNDGILPTGTTVQAGETIAYLGASGNVSGPHVHVEIFNFGTVEFNEFIKSWNGDLSFGNGYGERGLSNTCQEKGSTPCREKPEEKLGSN